METVSVYVKLPKSCRTHTIRSKSKWLTPDSHKSCTICLICDLNEDQESIGLKLNAIYSVNDSKVIKKVFRRYKQVLRTHKLQCNLQNFM